MSNIAKSAIVLVVMTMLSKVLGFVREMVLASTYGASSVTDAYLMAITIPTILFVAIGGAIQTTYIPLYTDINKNLGKDSSVKFTNNLINATVIVTIIVSILGMIFTEQVVSLFAIGFKGETLRLAISFTRLLLPSMIFMGVTYILTAYLQSNNNFLIPSLVGVPFNIVIISSILLSVKFGYMVMIWGMLLATFVQILFQLPYAYKTGYKYKPIVNLKDENVKKMGILILPVFLGYSVNQINILIDRTLASTLVEGSISALNYASRLNGFVIALFVYSITTVIYPLLSNLSLDEDKTEFKQSVVKSINSVILLVLPISVGAMILSTPIVKILFERGSFDSSATLMTSEALFYFSIGMVTFGVREVLSRVFFSMQDTKTPMINSVIAIAVNIALNLILIKHMGLGGLALGTSLSGIVAVLLLGVSLRKKIGAFGVKSIIITLAKVGVSCLAMAIVVKFTYGYLSSMLDSNTLSEIIKCGVSVLIGIIVYAVGVIVLKIEELKIFINMVKKKIKK